MGQIEKEWFGVGAAVIGIIICGVALYYKKWTLAAVGFNMYITAQVYINII